MPSSHLQTAVISLFTSAAAVAVGFGLFGETTEQVVVSAAGTLVALVFQVLVSAHIIKES